MIRKSSQVAMGGIASAVCLMLMITTIFPMLSYAMPAMAGMVLVIIVVENGRRTAAMVFTAVSFLSLFICPDKEAAMMFIGFFGFYPIVKGLLERIKFRLLRWICKFAVFNTAVVITYLIIIYVFGIADMLEESGGGMIAMMATLGMGNIVFVLYDYSLTKLTAAYVYVLRKKIFRRLG